MTRRSKSPKKVEKPRPIRTFFQPAQSRTEGPAAASPAPASPAISSWVSLVGIPEIPGHAAPEDDGQHGRALLAVLMISGSTMPLPIVVATAVPVTRTPTILSTAAISTALRRRKDPGRDHGGHSIGSIGPAVDKLSGQHQDEDYQLSGIVIPPMLEGNPFKDVGDVLASVRGALHVLVDLPPLYDLGHVRRVIE